MVKLKKKLFIFNTILITVTSFLLRGAGMFLRIYLSGKLQGEGMGLFQLIMSVYMVAVTISTSSISMGVTRLVSEGENAFAVIKKASSYIGVLSICASVALFFCSNQICTWYLKDLRAVSALKILSISLPFIGLSACMKGFFVAKSRIAKTSVCQIAEETVKISVIIVFFELFETNDLTKMISYVMVGTSLSEVVSCACLYLFYKFDIAKEKRCDAQKKIVPRLLNITMPLTFGSCMGSALRSLENTLIPSGLLKSGMTKTDSLSVYGMLRGMTLPVLLFPSSLLTSFSTLLVPEISYANSCNYRKRINYTISRVFQIALVISIYISGCFIMFSEQISQIIYKNSDVGQMIKILAPLVPLMYIESVVSGILVGLDKQMSIFGYSIFDYAIRISLIYFLLPNRGFEAIIFVMYVSNILTPSLCIIKLIRVTKVSLSPINQIIKPSFCIVVSCIVTHFLISNIDLQNIISVVIFGFSAVLFIYIVLLFATNALCKDDVIWLKSIFLK